MELTKGEVEGKEKKKHNNNKKKKKKEKKNIFAFAFKTGSIRLTRPRPFFEC
jgi:hypothetical protein